MLIPVILAGGIGSRLWPVSRALLPKQFISFPGQSGSLFQATLLRIEGIAALGNPIVVCNADHRFLAAEQLRQIQKQQNTILLEPVGRNTAPAVALAAMTAQQSAADPILLVLPADHVIQDQATLQKIITQGIELARAGKLVTFGIVPGSPETGYGYIEQGAAIAGTAAAQVSRFVEKPDLATAQTYIASGKYLWNSGMFMFSAARYLEELQRFAPDIYASCHGAFVALAMDNDFCRIPDAAFRQCRADSIDYAVMEHTADAVVLPLAAGWNDLGAWDALWEIQAKDPGGNVVSGDVLLQDTHNCYVQAQSRLVACVGLLDTIIVETADAVLVAHKNSVQAVKKLVAQLEQQNRPEAVSHTIVYRPWGSYQALAAGTGYQVKHIIVNPGAALSLQLHHQRAEHWTAIKGIGQVTCDDREFRLLPNETTFIPLGAKHRLSNPGTEPVEIIEVQVGNYLGEDDIVRFEDRYGRVSQTI